MQKILLKAAIKSKRPDIIKLLLTMGAKIDSSILTEVIVESENEYYCRYILINPRDIGLISCRSDTSIPCYCYLGLSFTVYLNL